MKCVKNTRNWTLTNGEFETRHVGGSYQPDVILKESILEECEDFFETLYSRIAKNKTTEAGAEG